MLGIPVFTGTASFFAGLLPAVIFNYSGE